MIPTVVIAGFPSSGKSSTIRRLVRCARERSLRPAVAAVRCDNAGEGPDEGLRAPQRTWCSDSDCPDHLLAQTIEPMARWASGAGAQLLLVETAGLCSRCSPFPERCVAVFTVDCTAGLGLPAKVGPMLQTCDLCVCTKMDRISATESTMFRAAVADANDHCSVVALNGLTGEGANEVWRAVAAAPVFRGDIAARHRDSGYGAMRTDLPQFFCTYCLGRTRVGILQV